MGDTVEVAALRSLTKQDIIHFYKTYVAASPTRRKLSCHVVSTSEGGAGHPDTVPVTNGGLEVVEDGAEAVAASSPPRTVTDITAFKSSLPLYPLAQPFVPSTNLCRPIKP